MRYFLLAAVLVLFVGCNDGQLAESYGVVKESGREVLNFNFGWRFFKGDVVGGEDARFDDSGWRGLDVPHDWSIEGPFDAKWASGTGYLPGGVGWYRKTFTINERDRGRKVFVYFGGVYNNSEVWINGQSVGRRPNGYVSFYYDLSEFVRFGESNVIAVRVDHSKFADSRWYTGSGIYRNVRLITTDRVYIRLWGVYARASLTEAGGGVVDVDVTVANDGGRSALPIVSWKLMREGEVVGTAEKLAAVKAGEETVVRARIEIGKPELWDVDSPALYSLVSSVRSGRDSDEVVTRIGFREVGFDADAGFFLNGKSMKLKGICIHHDAGCLGAAVPKDVLRRRLGVVKEMGCNAIRTSHNAFSDEFMDLCDEMGFLVIDEVFDEWELPKNKWVKGWNAGEPSKDGYAEYFQEWGKIDLRDVVLRDRNHACVIMWSIGNEVDYPNDPYSHEVLDAGGNLQTGAKFSKDRPHGSRLGEIARELVAVVKEYDSTRAVTAGLASALMSNAVGYADALDVVGYNYQEFRYEQDHAMYPERVLYGSENGMALEAWRAVSENDYILGQFLWTGIEYMGEAGRYPRRNSTSGVIDLAGHGKAEYYFRQSLWSDEAMVFVGVAKPRNTRRKRSLWAHHRIHPHWNWEDGETVRVTGVSNCEEVELFVNGRSLGRKRMADFAEGETSWEMEFEAGELRAVGYNGGKAAARFELVTAGEAAKLVVSSDKAELAADGESVAHVEVAIADKDGNLVYAARNEITCKVSGPVRLLGLEDANAYNTEDYKDAKQKAFKGRVLAYVQAFNSEGRARVKFSSAGLESAEVVIDVVSVK